jgi:hypothetical protein
MKKASLPKAKRSAVSKLTRKGLVAFEELQGRLQNLPNVGEGVGQVRLLDIHLADFVAQIPEVVIELLDDAEPISVADATARAGASGKSWQDVKATLELQVRLIRARALWERDRQKAAALELVQISHSPSSRRAELILEAAARTEAGWSAGFSLALLRSASGALANSLPAALALVDAMTGAGEQPAAALVLGQIIAGLSSWPDLDRTRIAERIERLAPEHRPALESGLAAAK